MSHITKIRAKRNHGAIPKGYELEFVTNSPNCFPGTTKVKEKLIEILAELKYLGIQYEELEELIRETV